ncbi:MAG: methyltransferase domain-containing protein [Chloroflexi bacterium]|nr:methyltransferase domain-containing protein [Chloroflexota bacterium]
MTGDVKQRFSQYAHGYVTSETHSQGHDLDRLIELAQPQPDWVVLDVATGGGHTALKFAPHVAKVIASDFAPPMLAEAKAFIESKGATNVEFADVDAENIPILTPRLTSSPAASRRIISPTPSSSCRKPRACSSRAVCCWCKIT